MQETLATELLHEIKAQSRRWFISFLLVLSLWFSTIGIFIWYVSLPVEENAITVDGEDGGNANYIGNDLEGDLYNGKN
jgi:hypothetical protein